MAVQAEVIFVSRTPPSALVAEALVFSICWSDARDASGRNSGPRRELSRSHGPLLMQCCVLAWLSEWVQLTTVGLR